MNVLQIEIFLFSLFQIYIFFNVISRVLHHFQLWCRASLCPSNSEILWIFCCLRSTTLYVNIYYNIFASMYMLVRIFRYGLQFPWAIKASITTLAYTELKIFSNSLKNRQIRYFSVH